MAGQKTVTTANKLLDHTLGGPDLMRPASVFAGLYNAAGAVISGGGYARVSVANNATSFPAAASGLKSTGVAIQFPVATGDWGEVAEAALYDSASAGWEIVRGFLGPASVVFTSEPAGLSNGLLTTGTHGLVVGDKVRLIAIPGQPMPPPLALNTTYFVETVHAAINAMVTLAATLGGAQIVLTDRGAGRIGKFVPKTVLTGDQFTLPAGQFTWYEI